MVLVGAGLSACSAAPGPIRVTSGLAQTFNGRAAQDRKGVPAVLAWPCARNAGIDRSRDRPMDCLLLRAMQAAC